MKKLFEAKNVIALIVFGVFVATGIPFLKKFFETLEAKKALEEDADAAMEAYAEEGEADMEIEEEFVKEEPKKEKWFKGFKKDRYIRLK